MQPSNSTIVAVVVTYQPNLKVLEQLLDMLVPQVKSIVIVDNGSEVDLEVWNNQRQTPDIKVLLLAENQGIAAAHNSGIHWALNHEAEFVLLMDQDSIPSPDMVKNLMLALREAENKMDYRPIAAGPACADARTGKKSYFVVEHNGMPSRCKAPILGVEKNTLYEACFLISSGALIDLKALQNVGGMRSNYFIDHVDTEWCFRARAKGYILLGVPCAQMQHTLGDRVKNIWFFGWRQVAYHSPLRDYYMFRNTFLMCKDLKISFVWRLYFLWRLVQFSSYFLLFTRNRYQRFRCMAMGVIHGMRGISGKVDIKTFQCKPMPISILDPANNLELLAQ